MTPKRLLIIGGIGCGSVVLLGVFFVIGFAFWITRSGDLLEPQRLRDDRTTGYVEWTLRLEDPGTEAFVGLVVENLQGLSKRGNEVLPPWMGTWLSGQQNRKTERDVRKMFPMVLAWTLRPSADGDQQHLFSVSLQQMGNRLVFIDWTLGWFMGADRDSEIVPHAGEKLYVVDIDRRDTVVFFIRGNDLFFTSDLETAQQAVDSLNRAVVESSSSELERLFAATPQDSAMRGALTNSSQEVVQIWDIVAEQDDRDADRWERIEGASFNGGLREDGAFSGRLELLCPDESWAETHAEPLARAFADGLAWTPFEIETRGSSLGHKVVVDVRIPDVVDAMGRLEID